VRQNIKSCSSFRCKISLSIYQFLLPTPFTHKRSTEDLCDAQKMLIAIPAGYERQADGHAVRSCESGHVNYWHVRSLDRAGQPMAILESLRLLTVHTELKTGSPISPSPKGASLVALGVIRAEYFVAILSNTGRRAA